jgi:hypothetical protein
MDSIRRKDKPLVRGGYEAGEIKQKIDREGKVVFQHPTGRGSKAALQQLLDAEED